MSRSRSEAWYERVLESPGGADDVAAILSAKLGSLPLPGKLEYLSACLARCDDVVAPADVRDKVGGVKHAVVEAAYASIDAEGAGSAASVLAAAEARQLSRKLLARLLDKVGEAPPPWAGAVVKPLLSLYAARLRGRTSVTPKQDEVGLLSALCCGKTAGAKLCAGLLAETEHFLPDPPGSRIKDRRAGTFYQESSLLGWLLAANPVDYASLAPDQRGNSPMQVHFKNLRKTEQAVQHAQDVVRSPMVSHIDQGLQLVNAMLRAGEGPRARVLAWFGKLLAECEGMCQMVAKLPHTGHLVDVIGHEQCEALASFGGQISIHALVNRARGYVSTGAGVMIAWTCLRLVEPIKLEQVNALDPFALHREEWRDLLGAAWHKKESCFGSEEELAAMREGLTPTKPDFKSQVFWLAMKAVRCMLLPAMQEAEKAAEAAGHFMHLKERQKSDDAYSHWLSAEVVYNCRPFQEVFAKYVNLTLGLIVASAWPGVTAGPGLSKALDSERVPPSTVSPQFAALPEFIVEDLLEVLTFYSHCQHRRTRHKDEFIGLLDAELLTAVLVLVMGSGAHIRNPNARGKAAKWLHTLDQPRFHALITQWGFSIANCVPACIEVFCAVEKTKMSYYDIRFHVKYELRIPIMALFQRLLPLAPHRAALQRFTDENPSGFLKFVNQLLNDSTYLLDEGIDTLVEIRRRAAAGEEGDAAAEAAAGSAGLGIQRDMDDEDQNEAGEDIYRRSRHDPKAHCKQYMDLAHRTVKTLYMMATEAPGVLVKDEVVLQQMTHNFLDANLDRLVGGKCLELKAKSGVKDFEEYNFDPKTLLAHICTIYVVLVREAKAKTLRFISEDERYYKPSTFKKAARILSRERMMAADLVADFKTAADELEAFATKQEEALADVDIPDEFLDPIMSDLMTDPVMLPTSQKIMDRKHIVRIIMSDDQDPFSRVPLKTEDLIPQTELKARIHEFAKQHDLSLD